MLIAKSYGNLKTSVVRTSSETLGSLGSSVSGTIRKHPYATAGAAVGLGIVMFGLFRLMSRGGSSQKRDAGSRGHLSDMGREIFSLLTPVLMPYISAYLEKHLGMMFSKKQRNA